MKVILVHLILLSPVYLEALFDKMMWSLGKSDKPISTYVVRPIVMIGSSLLVSFIDGKEWWRAAIMVLGYHFFLFPYLINWIRGERWDYLSPDNWYDRQLARIPSLFRVFLQAWIAVVCITIYYYQELYVSTMYYYKTYFV